MTDKNRLDLATEAARVSTSLDRGRAEYAKFTADGHVRVCEAYPRPKFDRIAARSLTSDDAAPGSTTSALKGEGYKGLSGYLVFTNGTTPSADIELWLYDREGAGWFLEGTAQGVLGSRLFRFPSGLRGHDFFVRVRNLQGSSDSCSLRLTLE